MWNVITYAYPNLNHITNIDFDVYVYIINV